MYDSNIEHEKQLYESEHAKAQDLNQQAVRQYKKQWAFLNAEGQRHQITDKRSRFERDGEAQLDADREFISKIGFSNFNSNKADRKIEGNETLMNYFYKDKTRQAVKQTRGQKLVFELGRKLQTAKNERQKKFEI